MIVLRGCQGRETYVKSFGTTAGIVPSGNIIERSRVSCSDSVDQWVKEAQSWETRLDTSIVQQGHKACEGWCGG